VASGAVSASAATVEVRSDEMQRYRPITTYTIFNAMSGVAGRFSAVATDLGYLNGSLQYEGNGINLTLRRNDVDFRSAGTASNQTAVASSLNALVSSATGAMATVINNVYELSSAQAMRAMTSMTGVAHQHLAHGVLASTQTFLDINMTRLGQIAGGWNEAIGGSGGAAAGSTGNQAVWLKGLAGVKRFAGNDVDSGARVPTRGLVFGYEAAFQDNILLGVSGSESWPDLELQDGSSHTNSQLFHFGAYGQVQHKASRFTGVFGAGNSTNKTARAVTDGFASWRALASYGGWEGFFNFQYGHRLDVSRNVTIEPQVGFQFMRASLDSFTENDADALSLVVPKRIIHSERTHVGLRARRSFNRGKAMPMAVEARGAWVHEFSPLGDVRLRFLGDAATDGFELAPPKRNRNGAVLGGSFMGSRGERFQVFVNTGVELAESVKGWTSDAGARVSW
jgi:uncharacterized protein with beta-barrel porin domain